MAHAVLTDGAEEGLGQAAVSPVAHHEQVRTLGRLDQHRSGLPFHHARADHDVGLAWWIAQRSAALDDSKPSTPTTMRGTAFMRSSW